MSIRLVGQPYFPDEMRAIAEMMAFLDRIGAQYEDPSVEFLGKIEVWGAGAPLGEFKKENDDDLWEFRASDYCQEKDNETASDSGDTNAGSSELLGTTARGDDRQTHQA